MIRNTVVNNLKKQPQKLNCLDFYASVKWELFDQLNLRCLSFLFRVERVDIIKDNVCNYL